MRRRTFVRALAATGALAAAGCVGDDEEPADSGDSTDDATSEPTEGDEHRESEGPAEAVEAFVAAWQESDREAVDALVYEDGDIDPPTADDLDGSPTLETLETPEVDDDSATVETLFVPPEADEPMEFTFELTLIEDDWLLADVWVGAGEEAPSVAFETDFEDGELEIVHASGDTVRAGALFVRGDDIDDSWAELADDLDPDTDVTAGTAVTVEVGDEYELSLVWDDGENSATLLSVAGARDGASD